MKIIDCEKQLENLLKKYKTVSNEYEALNDIIINRDKINLELLRSIVIRLDNLYNILPGNIRHEIDNYINKIEYTGLIEYLKTLSDEIYELSNKFDADSGHFININRSSDLIIRYLSSFDSAKNELVKLSDAINIMRHLKQDTVKDYFNIDFVFEQCLRVRSIIWEYIVSLELPVKPDWEKDVQFKY